MNNLSLILIYIFSILLLVKTQTNDQSICTHINFDSFFRYVDLNKLDNIIYDSIKNNPYPLNNRILMDSVVKNENPCPFRERVLLKMSKNETITIAIIGGSNTYGAGIPIDTRFKLRWSNLLYEKLNNGWYQGKFEVINISRGGWSVNQWNRRIDEIARINPDLIITDMTVNDSSENDKLLISSYQIMIKIMEALEKKPSIFNYITFKLTDNNIDEKYSIKYNITLSINGTNRYSSYYYFWIMHDYSKTAYNQLQVPYSSLRDLIYPDFFNPPDNLYNLWTGSSHPGYITHKYMSDHILTSLTYIIKDSLLTNKCYKNIKKIYKNPINFCNRKSYLANYMLDNTVRPVCYYKDIINLMEYNNNNQLNHSFIMSNTFNYTTSKWKYYADSNNKYGWIYDEELPNVLNYYDKKNKKFYEHIKYNDLPIDHILSFNITIQNAIQISYLSTYNQYTGAFIVWLNNDINNSVYIDTRWLLKYSIPSTYYLLLNNKLKIYRMLINNIHKYLPTPSSNNIILNIFPFYSSSKNKIIQRIKVKILEIITC